VHICGYMPRAMSKASVVLVRLLELSRKKELVREKLYPDEEFQGYKDIFRTYRIKGYSTYPFSSLQFFEYSAKLETRRKYDKHTTTTCPPPSSFRALCEARNTTKNTTGTLRRPVPPSPSFCEHFASSYEEPPSRPLN